MTTIDVEGMSCTGCEDNVTDALGELPEAVPHPLVAHAEFRGQLGGSERRVA
jgi:copper chaperone CopZ